MSTRRPLVSGIFLGILLSAGVFTCRGRAAENGRYLVGRRLGEGIQETAATEGIQILEIEPGMILGAVSGVEEELRERLRGEWEIIGPLSVDRRYFVAMLLGPRGREAIAESGNIVWECGSQLVFWASRSTRLKLDSRWFMLKELTPEPLTRSRLRRSPQVSTWSPLVSYFVTQVQEAEIEQTLRRLVSFQTRYSYTDSCRAASRYIVERFQSSGIDSVVFDSFAPDKAPNVVGTIPGETTPEQVYILCGHYDSVAGAGSDTLAPGADDNGSGTTTLLEAARILGYHRFQSTIKFIAFSGEEQGLLGSRHYADSLALHGERVAGVLNLDMVAYDDPQQPREDLTVYTQYPSEFLADLLVQAGADFTALAASKVVLPVGYSDHESFWDRGYPAIMAIEEPVTGGNPLWNPYYHTPGDTVGTLSFPFLTDVARATVAAVAQLAVPVSGLFSPWLRATPGDRHVTLTWGDESEIQDSSVAFEGYRIYRSTPDSSRPMLLARYDRVDSIPPNTGLVHTFTDSTVANGFPYWYAVTAFDTAGTESQRSNFVEVFPVELSGANLDRVRVVPNPYRPSGPWMAQGWGDGVHFENLPSGSRIRVFTLGGDLVRSLPRYEHSATGAPCGWNLRNDAGELVGAGIYLYAIESPGGDKVGKLVIVR